MLVVAADSGSALLDGFYRPIKILSTVAVLAQPPYRNPLRHICGRVDRPPEDPGLLVEELKLIMKLLDSLKVRVEIAHIDITLGALDLSELRLEDLETLDFPRRTKDALRTLLPLLQPHLRRLREEYGVRPLAVGKESSVVRLAELGTAAYAALYAMRRCARERRTVLVGLPKACSVRVEGRAIVATSLLPGEHDMSFRIPVDPPGLETQVVLDEYPNPIARGFRVLEARPASP